MRFPVVHTVSEEKTSESIYTDSVRLRKVPKLHHREDETAKRRLTIAVSGEVAEAIAAQSTARRGRLSIQRESSMKFCLLYTSDAADE